MAYKFSRGIYKHSGSLTAEHGAAVDQGGLTVSAGTSALQSVTATTISGSGNLAIGGKAIIAQAVTASAGLSASADIYAPAFHGALDAAAVQTHISVTDTAELDFSYSAGAISADLKAGSIANSKLTNSSVSVAGKSVSLGGSILLNTADVSEDASNKYFTDARARAAVSVTDNGGDGSLSYDSATGVISYTGPSAAEARAHFGVTDTNSMDMSYDSSTGKFSSDLRISGSALEVNAGGLRIASAAAGTGLAWADGVLSVDTAEISAGLSGSVRDIVADFVEGSDFVTFDDSTGTIGVSGAAFTGSARSVVSVTDNGGDGSLSYDASTGVISYTGPSAAEARAHFSAVDAGGDGSFSYADGVFTYTGPSASEVRAHFSAGDGLAVADGAFSVNVDNSSVEISSDALRVKAAGITNAMLAGSIENAKLVNSAVTVNGTTGEIDVDGGALSLGGAVTIGLADTISGARTFTGTVTINNLNVTGTMTTINTTNLEVADALIKIASGSVAFANDHGIQLGDYASLKTAQVNIDGVTGLENVLSSSLPLVAPQVSANTFYGNLVGTMQLSYEAVSLNHTISKNITAATANVVLTLPSSPVVGQEHRIKCKVADGSAPAVTIQPQAGGATIDGDSVIVLESFGAGVSLVWDGANWMVF